MCNPRESFLTLVQNLALFLIAGQPDYARGHRLTVITPSAGHPQGEMWRSWRGAASSCKVGRVVGCLACRQHSQELGLAHLPKERRFISLNLKEVQLQAAEGSLVTSADATRGNRQVALQDFSHPKSFASNPGTRHQGDGLISVLRRGFQL